LGIVLAFVLGSSLFRPMIKEWSDRDPRILQLDKAVEQEAFKLVVLLRLTPIFPFGMCNFILSGTSIQLKTVMLGSLLGNLPNACMHALIGSLAGPSGKAPPRMKYLMLLSAVCFGILSSVFITAVAKRALRQVVDLESTLQPDPDLAPQEGLSEDDEQTFTSFSTSDPLVNPASHDGSPQFTPEEVRVLYRTAAAVFVLFVVGVALILGIQF
ncbi:hypothetical protein HDU91_005090, partial [Kappamyces sp. JEL0680]